LAISTGDVIASLGCLLSTAAVGDDGDDAAFASCNSVTLLSLDSGYATCTTIVGDVVGSASRIVERPVVTSKKGLEEMVPVVDAGGAAGVRPERLLLLVVVEGDGGFLLESVGSGVGSPARLGN
jgi:hypothetical protein